MRSIVVHHKGGPEKLVLDEVPDPGVRDGHVTVAVAAAGLNFIDTYHRGGLYPMDTPFTPGLEGAGTVVDVGAGVESISAGDRVAWSGVMGSYAELVLIPAEKAVLIPEGVTEKQAAAVMLQGITAHYLVTDTYPLKAGERCLIHAGAGGVGLLLTQMAKSIGAEAITTVGSEVKVEASRGAGADFVVNYGEDDFKQAIEAEYGPKPVDVVYDGVGAATFERSLELLRPRGMMVTFGNASGPPDPVSPLDLMRRGSLFLTRPTLMDHTASRQELVTRATEVLGQVAGGDLHVTVGAEYALADAAEAHRALEGRETIGKVLILP